MNSDNKWIFGYGSLVWKPDFPYVDSEIGYLKGYMRRFWQGNTDHRGKPGAPGRVVTLIQNDEEITWGIGYKLNPENAPEILNKLNHREQDGFITKEMAMYPIDSNKCPITVLVYIATETNPSYLGPAPEHEIAKQVVHSKGPSGSNTEYVLRLADWMRYILPSVPDDHLFDIETEILKISSKY